MTTQPRKILRPKCPRCGEGMVPTFAFNYKEFACLPCDTTDEYIPHNETILVDEEDNLKKKKLWQKDILKIGFGKGGATCSVCHNIKNHRCKSCREVLAHKYQYWKSNLK